MKPEIGSLTSHMPSLDFTRTTGEKLPLSVLVVNREREVTITQFKMFIS
mgnify:CR=1 FL=1